MSFYPFPTISHRCMPRRDSNAGRIALAVAEITDSGLELRVALRNFRAKPKVSTALTEGIPLPNRYAKNITSKLISIHDKNRSAVLRSQPVNL